MKSNAALKLVVTNERIDGLLAMRESLDVLKKRYEALENAVKAAESDIIDALETGAVVYSRRAIKVRSVERRYPSWKSHFAEVAGAAEAERVLAATTPSIQKVLVIK